MKWDTFAILGWFCHADLARLFGSPRKVICWLYSWFSLDIKSKNTTGVIMLHDHYITCVKSFCDHMIVCRSWCAPCCVSVHSGIHLTGAAGRTAAPLHKDTV